MAEQAPEAVQEEPEKKKGGKQIILGLAIVPIVTVLTFFLTAKFIGPRFAVPAEGATTASEEQEKESKPAEAETVICDLGTVLANPAGSKKMRIMKVTVALDVVSQEIADLIAKYNSRLQDNLVMILSSKSFETISSTEGKTAIKKELRDTFISELKLGEDDIRRVYFSEFVIQ